MIEIKDNNIDMIMGMHNRGVSDYMIAINNDLTTEEVRAIIDSHASPDDNKEGCKDHE